MALTDVTLIKLIVFVLEVGWLLVNQQLLVPIPGFALSSAENKCVDGNPYGYADKSKLMD